MGVGERKCPCRQWENCSYYVDSKKQQQRIEKKSYDFHEWYELYFRIDYRMPEGRFNG